MTDPTEIIIENGESVPTQLPIPTERQRERTRKKFIPRLLRLAGRIPFADDLAAAYYCATDAATPRKAKLVLFAALGYFMLPTDAIPDMIAGFGFTDDATVLATAIGVVGAYIKPEHYAAAERLLRITKRDRSKSQSDPTAA